MLPAPTAPSEGYAGVRNLVDKAFALPTRSRSWLTSSGVAFHRTTPSCEEPDRSTRLRGPKVRWSFDRSGPASGTEVPRSQNRQCSAALLGSTTLASRFAHLPHEEVGSRVALEKTDSSGASSRLARSEPEGSSQSCRRRSDLWSPAASTCRCRLLERPGPPSRSPAHNAHLLRVAKAKNAGLTLWITGISGKSAGTFFDSPERAAARLPFRSPPPNSAMCLNRLHCPPNPLTCRV